MILSLLFALNTWALAHPYANCVDRLERDGLSKNALEMLFTRYYENKRFFVVDDHVLLADLSKGSAEKRFYLINPSTCRYFSSHLAHAIASDLNLDGIVESCGGKRMSPKGFYFAGGLYSVDQEYEANWNDSSWWKKPEIFMESSLKSYSRIGTLVDAGKEWPAHGIYLVPLEGQATRKILLREGEEASLKNVRRFQGALRSNGDLVISPQKLADLEKSLKISRGTLLLSYAPQCP